MPPIDPSFPIGPRTLFTNRDTVNWRFFPATGAMRTSGFKSVRMSIKMALETGDIELRGAVRYSDKGQVWDATPTTIAGVSLSADGEDFGAFADLPGTVKAFAQFGWEVKNESAGTPELEMCEGYMRLETRAC